MVDFQQDIEECLQVLKNGGLILYPTDTIWGIGCDATNAEAVKKVYALKKRADEKAMIVLVADEREVLQYIAAADFSVFDYLKQNERPTTVVYDGAIGLADNLISADGSVAIRICQELFCKHLIKRFRKPIVSTSANLSGLPSPRLFSDISAEIRDGVDYIVKYRQLETTVGQSSMVIKWNRDGSVTVLRP